MKISSARILLKVFIISITSFFLLIGEVHAQEASKPKIEIPNHGISLSLGGAILVGFTLDYRLSNKLSLEVNLGAGYGGGFKYAFRDPTKHRLNAFTGIYYTSNEASTETDSVGVSTTIILINGNSLYIPLGLSYLGKNNYQYSLEAGAFISQDQVVPFFGLKIGHRFSVDYEKIKNREKTEKTSKRNILSGSLLGMTPIVGIVYERLLTPFLGIDVGVGTPSIGAGFKLYVPQIREDKISFHIGASHHFNLGRTVRGWKTYFPIGLSLMTIDGIRISFDLGPHISWHENIGSNYDPFFSGNFRVGKAF